MDRIEILENFPSHLFSEIILRIEPKYIEQYKRLGVIDSETERRYRDQWYRQILLNIKDDQYSHQQELKKSLKLQYYELFEQLWEDYLNKYAIEIKYDKRSYYKLINQLFVISAFIGNRVYLDWLLSLMKEKRSDPDYNKAMRQAALGGQIEIVQWLSDLMKENQIDPDYHWAMANAAKGGQIEIVKLILDLMKENQIEPNYHWTMGSAAKGGQIEIVQWLLDLMKENQIDPDYNWAIVEAIKGGHGSSNIKIVRFFLNLMKENRIQPNYNEAMRYAVGRSRRKIVLLMIILMKKNGIEPDYDSAMRLAKSIDDPKMVELIDNFRRQ